MRTLCTFGRTAIVASALAMAPAFAAVTLTASGGPMTSTAGAVTVINFDTPNSPLVSSAAFAGNAGQNNGSNPGGGGSWGSIAGQGGSYTVNFAGLADYVGFLWGTPDGGNTVQLFNGGTLVTSFTSFSAVSGSGSFADFTAGGSADYFNKVVFSFSSCCFEFDNIAARLVSTPTSVVPLPAPVALLGSGLLVLGGLARRRLQPE
jgi:hypothetical protein